MYTLVSFMRASRWLAARLPVMYSTGVILKPMSLFWLWILLRYLFFRDTEMGPPTRVEPVCTFLQTAGLRNVGLLVSLGFRVWD